MAGETFFTYAAELLKLQPPHITDQPIVARMARIGIVPGESFDPRKLDPTIQKALASAPGDAQKLMAWKLPTIARVAERGSQGEVRADQVSSPSPGAEASRQRRAVRVGLQAHPNAGIAIGRAALTGNAGSVKLDCDFPGVIASNRQAASREHQEDGTREAPKREPEIAAHAHLDRLIRQRDHRPWPARVHVSRRDRYFQAVQAGRRRNSRPGPDSGSFARRAVRRATGFRASALL